MAKRKGLQPISSDDPIDGHGANVSPIPCELATEELLFEMVQIPVVTQNSHGGELFYICECH
jgi:hypothetical protein